MYIHPRTHASHVRSEARMTDQPPCKHPDLKTHTFRDGAVIRCCPDCTQFDAARAAVLSPPHVQIQTKLPSPYFQKDKVYQERTR